jgi:lysozyme
MDTPRRITGLLLLSFSSLLMPAMGLGPMPPDAKAASYACPIEDRTTRPNNGGARVASFPVKGLDLSHHNSGYTMTAVKAAGFSFEYYKATQGTYMIDKTYSTQTARARTAGLKAGAYHFFDYRLDGVAQARYFVAAVKARGGFHGRLRPVVDVECLGVLGKPVPYKAVPRLRAFLTEVRRLIGVAPIIYTSIQEWKTTSGASAKFGDTLLWSAEWARTAPLKFPPGWTKWTFWQHGSAFVTGIRLDGNVYAGSAASLAGLIVK